MKNYTDKAELRGIPFNLCLSEFRFLIEQECHYCGAPPTQRMEVRYPPKPWYIPFLYNGIDRRDNNIGYTLENCLPCCGTCNMMKRDMGYQEFLEHIAKIHACLSDHSISNS